MDAEKILPGAASSGHGTTDGSNRGAGKKRQ